MRDWENQQCNIGNLGLNAIMNQAKEVTARQVGDKEYGELHAKVKNDKGCILPNLSTGKDNLEKLPSNSPTKIIQRKVNVALFSLVQFSECSTFLTGAIPPELGNLKVQNNSNFQVSIELKKCVINE